MKLPSSVDDWEFADRRRATMLLAQSLGAMLAIKNTYGLTALDQPIAELREALGSAVEVDA